MIVKWGARKISWPRRESRSGPGSQFKKKDTMPGGTSKHPIMDDPSYSLRMKYGTLSPYLLTTSPVGATAAAAVPPPQQPAFARDDSLSPGFAIPAFYNYPSRTELFSPLGSASTRLQMQWNTNPLASTPAEPAATSPGAGPTTSPTPSSSRDTLSSDKNNVDSSTRGWRSLAAAVNSQSTAGQNDTTHSPV